KTQLEKDGFIHSFLEFYRVCFGFLGGYPNGFLTHHIPRTVNRVYADIHHGAATGKVSIQPPLAGVANPKTTLSLKELDFSEFASRTHSYHFHGLGFEMHPVAY